jgi:hypothetical protein
MPFHIRLFLTLSLALITLLVLSSGPAYAEWVAVSVNDETGVTAYFDPHTIRRKGELVKMWVLYDYKTVQTMIISFLSIRKQHQFDCAEERTRTFAERYFTGNMGSGKVVFNNSDEGKWSPVQPGSVGQILWNYACGKQ